MKSYRIKVVNSSSTGAEVVLTPGKRLTVGRGEHAQLRVASDTSLKDAHFVLEWREKTPMPVAVRSDATGALRWGTALANSVDGPVLVAPQEVTRERGVRAGEFLHAGATIFQLIEEVTNTASDPQDDDGVVRLSTANLETIDWPGRGQFPRNPDALDDHDPRRIDRYSILRLLGRGAQATVYEALDEIRLHRVAIKLLEAVDIDREAERRFLREQKLMKQATHPNVVHALTFGSISDPDTSGREWHFMAMELLQGGTAMSLADGNVSLDQGLTLAEDLFRGLDHLHQKGIVHRDIKLTNLLLTHQPSNRVPARGKLSDLGLSRSIGDPEIVTQAEQVGGTFHALAPEQIQNFRGAPMSADLYAAGATIYRLFTGKVHFDEPDGADANNGLRWVDRIRRAPRFPLRAFRRDVPESLGALLDALVQVEPTYRAQNSAGNILSEFLQIRRQLRG